MAGSTEGPASEQNEYASYIYGHVVTLRTDGCGFETRAPQGGGYIPWQEHKRDGGGFVLYPVKDKQVKRNPYYVWRDLRARMRKDLLDSGV